MRIETPDKEMGKIPFLKHMFIEIKRAVNALYPPFVIDIDTIQFDLEPSQEMQEGRMQWNPDEGTIDIGLPGGVSTLQVGQETVQRCKNVTESPILNGSVVYVSDASGRNAEISLASATAYTTSFVLGLATEDINTFGYVCTNGKVHDINTKDMPAKSLVWLSETPGMYTITRPTAPSLSVFLGIVLYEHQTEGVIVIRPTFVPRMVGLSDVFAAIATNGQFYKWNSTNSRFEERTEWNDLRITPGAFVYDGVGDPSLIDWQPGGTGTSFKVYAFLTSTGGFFMVQLEHGYEEDSSLYVHVHWTPHSRGIIENGHTVAWKVAYTWTNINANFSAASIVDLTDTCTGVNDKHEISPEVEIVGTDKNISSMLVGKIYRDTGDTWAGTIAAQSPVLLELDFHFKSNTVGSAQRTSKD